MDKNLPASAGDLGSICDLRSFHMLWGNQPWVPQLLKPVRLEPMLHNQRGHCSEKSICCNEESPPLATTGESWHTAAETQHSRK